MSKPNAVLKRAAEADAEIKRLAGPVGTTTVVPPIAAQPPADPPLDPAATPPADPQPDLFAQPPADPAQVEPPLDGQVQPGDTDAQGDTAEKRHRVLQGKYNAETKRYRSQLAAQQNEISQLKDQVANMTSLLATVNNAKTEPAPPPAPADPKFSVPEAARVSEKDRTEFGEELLDAAFRYTMEQMRPAMESLQAELRSIKQQLSDALSNAAKTAEETKNDRRAQFDNRLSELVPEWREMNTMPELLQWLAQKDRFSGMALGDLLRDAQARNDADRAAAFFLRFKSEHADLFDSELPPAADTPAQPAAPAVDPATLVTPGKGRSAPKPGAQDNKIVWTPQSIGQFYHEAAQGEFRDKPDERARLEKDIFAAQREGRVRQA